LYPGREKQNPKDFVVHKNVEKGDNNSEQISEFQVDVSICTTLKIPMSTHFFKEFSQLFIGCGGCQPLQVHTSRHRRFRNFDAVSPPKNHLSNENKHKGDEKLSSYMRIIS